MNKKIYKGYELIKAMQERKIKENTKFKDKYGNVYIYKNCDLEEIYCIMFKIEKEGEYVPDYSMFVDNEFQATEDNLKDIKELVYDDLMTMPAVKANEIIFNTINGLVKAVNKLEKEF